MTKCTKDLAAIMDVITDPENVPLGGYAARVRGSWEGLKIGTLDPEKWNASPAARKVLDERMEKQLVRLACKLVVSRSKCSHVLKFRLKRFRPPTR